MIHRSGNSLVRCRSFLMESTKRIVLHYGYLDVQQRTFFRNVAAGTRIAHDSATATPSAATTATSNSAATTSNAVVSSPLPKEPSQLLQGSNTHSLGKIVRHGRGDACITLNVGGKEFYTLRSTIAMNSVLSDHVARAEQNHEILRNGAVFIDRDPEHFPILLKYLRNRVEYETLRNYVDKTSLKRIVKSFIDLPSDPKVLRELYIEAVFYRMKDLQDTLKDTSVLVQMASVISKTTGNPFDWIIKFWAQLRNLLVGMSVVGGSYMVAAQNEWNWILQRVGLRKKDRHTHSEIFE
jgi:BTB/POZ domain